MFGLSPSGGEFLILLLIALLLFGKNLPQVARNLGKGMREFQSGIRGLTEEVNKAPYSGSSNYSAASSSSNSTSRPIPDEELEDDFSVPKFEPPTSAPTEAADTNESRSHDV